MSYTPTAYTDRNTVKRILRTVNNKVSFGSNPNDVMSNEDLDAYILDASRKIDATLMKVIGSVYIPLTDTYPEISYAAPRLAAFLVYRDLYQAYRYENLPMGPRGWIQDFSDDIKLFIENINSGSYPGISASVDGPSWQSIERFLINKIGVSQVHDQLSIETNQLSDTDSDNLGPWGDS